MTHPLHTFRRVVEIRKTNVLWGIAVIFLVILATNALADDLMIQSFELDSIGEDEEVKPTETLTIKFDVVNVADSDIEDIEVEMWFQRGATKLEGNDGTRISPVFDLRDIDEGEEKSVKYDLVIPWVVNEGEKYDVIVKMKGKNTNTSTRFSYENTMGTFRIEKESHELYIDASFNPDSLDCGDDAKLHVYIRNIGKSDEESVNLTAVNKLIGIDAKEVFYLDSDPEDAENLFEKTYSFVVNNNANPGTYELSVRALYDGGYKEGLKTISLKVNECEFASGSQPTQTTPPTTNTQTPNQSGNQQPAAQPTTNYVPAQPSAAATKKTEGMGTSTIVLIIIGEIALIIIIVLVYILVKRNRAPKAPEF